MRPRAPGRAGTVLDDRREVHDRPRGGRARGRRRLPGHRASSGALPDGRRRAAARGHRGRRRTVDRDAARAAARSGPRRHRPLDELVRDRGHGDRRDSPRRSITWSASRRTPPSSRRDRLRREARAGACVSATPCCAGRRWDRPATPAAARSNAPPSVMARSARMDRRADARRSIAATRTGVYPATARRTP